MGSTAQRLGEVLVPAVPSAITIGWASSPAGSTSSSMGISTLRSSRQLRSAAALVRFFTCFHRGISYSTPSRSPMSRSTARSLSGRVGTLVGTAELSTHPRICKNMAALWR